MNDQFRKFLLNQKDITTTEKQPQIPSIKLKQKRHVQVDLGKEIIEKKIKKNEETKTYNIMEKLLMNPIELVKVTKQYSFGNYKKYYKMRLEYKWNDPRLSVLDDQYFFNKTVLDIGCNDGTLTLLIALKHFPKLIRGIDIDYTLINKAIEQMTKLDDQQKKIQKQEFQPIIQDLPISFDKYMKEPICNAMEDQFIQQTVEQMEEKNQDFPNNVYFRVQNIVGNKKYDEKYDTIICFSITKWIHLNFGDLGIKRLFKNISDLLNIGGHLILEPQEWKSYKKKKYYSLEFKQNYKEIKIKPEDFEKLIIEYGFKLKQKINPDDEMAIQKSKSNFKRPILIFERVLKNTDG